jgi:uncharacterized protein
MQLNVNLRHLEENTVRLEGNLPVEHLDLDLRDELIEARTPLAYDLEVQMLEHNLLVQGNLSLVLDCQCARCLKPFKTTLQLNDWACHLPLEGEDAVVVNNDFVDLTPYIREDILLEFPQHPLCDAECRGLPKSLLGKGNKPCAASPEVGSSAWAELNKLKLEN